MKVEVGVTAEELLFEYNGRKLSADAELQVSFDVSASEPRTWDYPGCPAMAEYVDYEVESMNIYDEDGNSIDLDAAEPLVICEIETWLTKNEEYLSEQALEEADNAVEAARDAYAECKMEEMRERRYN